MWQVVIGGEPVSDLQRKPSGQKAGGDRAVKAAPLPKRKRKVAGPKVAPLIATPMVPFLSDTEWQPFLQWLPARPQPKLLRSELDRLTTTYLGLLDAEANSPSAREVATALEDLARHAHQFAQDLLRAPRKIPLAKCPRI